MADQKFEIVTFLIVATCLALVLACFIVSLIYLYQKKQMLNLKNFESLKLEHEKALLSTQLDIQEETFQRISREIHDNINLSLTLAKLHLNTLNLEDEERSKSQLGTSVKLITECIGSLSDISKGLNSDIVVSQGLINALKDETEKFSGTGLFTTQIHLTGEPVCLPEEKELILFRIIQEALNNVIKHAKATQVDIYLNYSPAYLSILVQDNGKGFTLIKPNENGKLRKAGLKNMESRCRVLNGAMVIDTRLGAGTKLNFHIPFK